MELWIRSQDRMTLCKCNNIYIDDEWVSPYYIKDDTLTLGKYSTKERALEVLDEIQNILQPPTNFIVSQHIDFANGQEGLIGVNVLKEEPKIERISDIIVYEMPKE